MEISQADRDSLREAQQNLNLQVVIGKLVEHKTQDPRKYRESSYGQNNVKIEMPKIEYNPMNFVASGGQLNEDSSRLDLPIALEDVHANLWVNMDRVELEKLEWMTKKADKINQEKQRGSTLFDRDGRIVAHDQSQSEDTESHSIDALVNLLDSTYNQQVTYALNVIAKIASLATMGYYDGAFDDNIHEILIKNCLLRVRHQLDNPNETICQSALKCLRSLLCNTEIDEVVLDRMFPLVSELPDSNLWLQSREMESRSFTIEMKDAECIEIDVVKALIDRTEILKRFSYLLQVKKGNFGTAYYTCILDILIRLARHSVKVGYLINRKDLLKPLLESLLPLTIMAETKDKQALAVKALKLIRIVALAIGDIELIRQKMQHSELPGIRMPEQIMTIVEAYFFVESQGSASEEFEDLLKLQIETLRLMKALTRIKQFRASVVSLLAMGRDKLYSTCRSFEKLNATKFLEPKISFDWQYTAHMIDLLGTYSRFERYHRRDCFSDSVWTTLIQPVLYQWLTDLVKVKTIPHLDVSITVSTSVYHLRCMNERGCQRLTDVMINSITGEHKDRRFNQMNLFKLLARCAIEESQLKNYDEQNGRLRDPNGLPSYGVLSFNTSKHYKFQLNPVVEVNSPFILLETFISQLQLDPLVSENTYQVFVDSIDLTRYIRLATGYHTLPVDYESQVQNSIFSQYEVCTIARSLLILGKYYLDCIEPGAFSETDEALNNFSEVEPKDLIRRRCESYSDLCYYTICTIGLIHAEEDHIIALKDKIVESILLCEDFQVRLSREIFMRADLFSSNYTSFSTGDKKVGLLSHTDLQLLKPIYSSCEHPNRFWIFQPLIDYYQDMIKEPKETNNRDGMWFQRQIDWKDHTLIIADTTDAMIVNSILNFHQVMMLYSPAYNNLVVKPNLEDYLCLVGIPFLDDDLFLDKNISFAISTNMRTFLKDCVSRKPNGKVQVPFRDGSIVIRPLEITLWDFFKKIFEQFESVSYGDLLFSNFLLLFMTLDSDKVFRKKLFQEKVETCLRQLRISTDDVIIPNEFFFHEIEKDPEMRELIRLSRPYLLTECFMSRYVIFHTQ